MVRRIKSILKNESYDPCILGLFTNPFYIARRRLKNAIKNKSGELSGSMLDVGCGTKPYESLFLVDDYIGLDIDNIYTRQLGKADYYYDGTTFPFEDEQFDSVVCNQVLEHVFNPDQFLGEIHRVLRDGGKLLLTIPFVWDEHEQPNDYARYSSFGLISLLQMNNFQIEYHKKIGTDITTLFQLLNMYIYKLINNKPYLIQILIISTIMSLISLVGIFIGKIVPKNNDFYLDQLVIARKLQ